MIAPQGQRYPQGKAFIAHATGFENEVIFFGRHHEIYTGPGGRGVKDDKLTSWLGGTPATVEEQKTALDRFVERLSWAGHPLRRLQSNNRELLTGQLYTVSDSMAFMFKGLYDAYSPKRAARLVFEAFISSYHKTYWDVGKDAIIRRGAGGSLLVRGEQVVPVAFHGVNQTGGFGPHLHAEKNGTGVDENGRPGAVKLEQEYHDDRLEQELFQVHLAEYCRVQFGWNVVIENGKAVVPGITKSMCRDANIGTRRREILGLLDKLGIPATRLATKVANYKTRVKPTPVFTLADRAPVWAQEYRHAVQQSLNWGPPPQVPVYSPHKANQPDLEERRKELVGRSTRRFERALDPGYWNWLGTVRNDTDTIYNLSTFDQLVRFYRDCTRASLLDSHRAAVRGIKMAHAFDILGALNSMEAAFAEARKSKFTPTKNTSIFVSEELSRQLSDNVIEWFKKLEKRTGCTVEFVNHPWLKQRPQQTLNLHQGPSIGY